jgi:hypothetical protein
MDPHRAQIGTERSLELRSQFARQRSPLEFQSL